jgi:hypothetical protein
MHTLSRRARPRGPRLPIHLSKRTAALNCGRTSDAENVDRYMHMHISETGQAAIPRCERVKPRRRISRGLGSLREARIEQQIKSYFQYNITTSPTRRRPCITEAPSLHRPACLAQPPNCDQTPQTGPPPASTPARPADSHRLAFERGEVFPVFSASFGIEAAAAAAAAAGLPKSFMNAGIHRGRESPSCGL